MPKNIVLSSDGTGKALGMGHGTNVARLHEALDTGGHVGNPSLRPQLALHDDGVGTEGPGPLRLLGAAFGWGVSRNVRELYTALCRWYEPGDAIFLFGFSRGAFTIRTLAGLVAQCGVIDRARWGTGDELDGLVHEAYATYRMRYPTGAATWHGALPDLKGAEAAAGQFRQEQGVRHWQHAPEGRVRIRFIGVWDTVDALGFPIDGVADFWNAFVHCFKFPSRSLPAVVEKACHAVSIDDERHTFHPVMWDERSEPDGRIEQVWFAGAHSNVGGGYPKPGMSFVPLHWMMKRAEAAGLRFIPGALQDAEGRQNVHDQLYDSRAGLAVCYRRKPRDIARICAAHGIRPKLHASVLERMAWSTEGYAPANLPVEYDVVGQNPEPMAEARLEHLVS